MQCKHCGFGNGEDDHRCLVCGRRLKGVVIAAPPGYSGANALAVEPASLTDTMTDETREFLAERAGDPAQAGLFVKSPLQPGPPPNVISFDQFRRAVQPATTRSLFPAPKAAAGPAQQPAVAQKTVQRKPAKPQVQQGTLDFVSAAGAKNRKLKTDVDAQIFCDQPVATPAHRCVASAIDGALILIGFGVLVVTFEALGGSLGAGKNFWIALAGVFTVVSMFYGLIWAIAGRETAGMRFTDLQLITFDGFPVDARSRALRFLSTWLSFCSGGLGILWAVADEENLTWHDHISKTFPTIREVPRNFVKQRR